MKNKFMRIFAVIALVLIAPIGVVMTGCGEKEPTLTVKSTNRSTVYIGETLQNVNWQAEYFDGINTTTITLTSDMLVGGSFSTTEVKTNATATFFYQGVSTTQTYSVEATPFNTSVVYECVQSEYYSYLKFANDGNSFTILNLDSQTNLTIDSSKWTGDEAITLNFTSTSFDSNGKWSATGVQTDISEGPSEASVNYLVTKESETTISVSVSGVIEGQSIDYLFVAL